MKQRSICLGLAAMLALPALAQSWQRPSACPASLQLFGTGVQHCPSGSCTLTVVVAPPSGEATCRASIPNGLLKVEPGEARRVKWQISPSCPASRCRFADVGGITILTDPDWQMDDPQFSASSPREYGWRDKNTVHLAIASYEPHVMWRASPQDVWQSCCPVDPKIIND
jgi:hypothetical protein